MSDRREYMRIYQGLRQTKDPERRAAYQAELDAFRAKAKAARPVRTAEQIAASKAHRREWYRVYARKRYQVKKYDIYAHTVEDLADINRAIRKEIDAKRSGPKPMTEAEFREWKAKDDARFAQIADPMFNRRR